MAETTPNEVENETSDSEVLGEGGKRALQAEREARASAERRVQELETTLQSATDAHAQKLAELEEQVAAANAAASAVSVERDRTRVAYEAGLPTDLVEFLKGDSVEDLQASAETLLAHVAKGQEQVVPKPDLSQGANGDPVAASTAEQFAAAFEQALR